MLPKPSCEKNSNFSYKLGSTIASDGMFALGIELAYQSCHYSAIVSSHRNRIWHLDWRFKSYKKSLNCVSI